MNLIRLLRTKRERSKSNNKITQKKGGQIQDGINNKQAAGNISDNGSYQANDNATLIVNSEDTKAQLTMRLDALKAEKQKWIDDEVAKHGLFGSTGMVMRDINRKAAIRYDERIKSLEKALNAFPFSQ